MNGNLLEVRNLRTHFAIRPQRLRDPVVHLKAVDDVSFDVRRGEVLGIVGESGCGKTTLGRTILRLEPKTSGSVLFDGRDVFALRGSELAALRRRMQMVFQDPFSLAEPAKEGALAHRPAPAHPPCRVAARDRRARRGAAWRKSA